TRRDASFYQHLMLQLRRMELVGDVLLDSQIVQLAFVLGQKTGDGLGVANNRAGDKVALLPQCSQRRDHKQTESHYRTPRKLIRSSFSWSVSFISKRRS